MTQTAMKLVENFEEVLALKKQVEKMLEINKQVLNLTIRQMVEYISRHGHIRCADGKYCFENNTLIFRNDNYLDTTWPLE